MTPEEVTLAIRVVLTQHPWVRMTPEEINDGLCGHFAQAVARYLEDHYPDTDTDSVSIATTGDLDEFDVPLPNHEWIRLLIGSQAGNWLDFDAECPEGTPVTVTLPIFERAFTSIEAREGGHDRLL